MKRIDAPSTSQLDFVGQSQVAVAPLSEAALESLIKKSRKSDIPLDVLEEVYRRGWSYWEQGLELTQEQFAFQRVNSFVAGGLAREMDSDLMDNDVLDEAASEGLAKKAAKSGISIGVLRKVYRRGVAAWNSGHRPGTTPQQWGMARVNSYITKGKGTYHSADKDLHEDLEESESWEAGYGRRVVKTTDPEHKKKGYNWRIKGKKRPEISIKLYKDRPSQQEFNKQMKRVAGHEFGESTVVEDSRLTKQAYHKGLSDSTAKARVAHWKKMDKLSDRDPRSYEPAPGDATSKTKESKHTKKYHQMYGEAKDPNDPKNRLIGTDDLVNNYKTVTPGQSETIKVIKKVVSESTYQGRSVPLNKPMKGDVKKSKVYVKNEKGNVVKVEFGDPNMTIKKHIPARRKSFRARHGCDNPGPKTKAKYWSCRAW